MRKAIGATIIKDKKILVVRKNKSWILPGGKPEAGESDITCLRREVREELSGTELKNIIYYNKFQGITPHTRDLLEAVVYFAEINGKLHEPSSEIGESAWVLGTSGINFSDITQKIINSLINERYL